MMFSSTFLFRFFSIATVITATILIANVAVFAWQEPSQSPPQGNASPPLNVGNIGQSKSGGLILNAGGAQTGLIVQRGSVGIGTINPASSALLDLTSTSQGLLLPRMSTGQRNAIANPEAGLQIFNMTEGRIEFFDGSEWQSFGAN